MTRMYHLTHNDGKDPWCGAPRVRYECGLDSVLVAPNYWCPDCRKLALRLYRREPGSVIEKGSQVLQPVSTVAIGHQT